MRTENESYIKSSQEESFSSSDILTILQEVTMKQLTLRSTNQHRLQNRGDEGILRQVPIPSISHAKTSYLTLSNRSTCFVSNNNWNAKKQSSFCSDWMIRFRSVWISRARSSALSLSVLVRSIVKTPFRFSLGIVPRRRHFRVWMMVWYIDWRVSWSTSVEEKLFWIWGREGESTGWRTCIAWRVSEMKDEERLYWRRRDWRIWRCEVMSLGMK